MNKYSLNISGKIDNLTLGLYEIINHVAEESDIPFFVAGATAREVIFYHHFDIQTGTATKDIDFGIKVSNWDQFDQLRKGLLDTGKFVEKNKHKLIYKKGIPLDLVPFGEIASKSASITWPPEDAIEMNILGFEEAYEHALWVRLRDKPILDIPFASIAGLALMKIISWNDGYTGNTNNIRKRRMNDSHDIAFIMQKYVEAGNNDRLFSDSSLMEIDNFDYEQASARLLGRDIASITKPNSRKMIFEILDRECNEAISSALVEDMLRHKDEYRVYETILANLQSLKQGMKDI